MKLKVNINFALVFYIIRGTKRFFKYHNEYGWEIGWNIIPRQFGVFFAVVRREAKQ